MSRERAVMPPVFEAEPERGPDPAAVKDLFGLMLEAQTAEPGEADALRAEAKRAAAASSPAVAEAAHSLLMAHRRASGVLLEPGSARGYEVAERPSAPPPDLSDYRVVRELGRGGFGVVYEAEQLRPVRRAAALKVLRADVASDASAARFKAEAGILARLQHPGIATVYDAGFDGWGRAYLAVELIRGEPITACCRRVAPPLPRLLELVAQVCDSVHHAHQRGVMHRDLKPANILVQEEEGRLAPKIIDFGIAKLTDQDEASGMTLAGQQVGTPRYMSPEQFDPAQPADTRSDVYALGVLLHELLVGDLPERLSGASGTATGHGSTLPRASVASARLGAGAATAPSELRGDLDRIVHKATSIEASLRYASAAEFAEDLRRFIRREPVRATPPSPAYQFRRFVARHPLGFAAGAAAAVAIAVLLLVTLDRERAAQDARSLAEASAGRAERVTEFFLRDMIEATDPVKARGIDRDPTISDLLTAVDRAVALGLPEDERMRFDLIVHAVSAHQQLANREDAVRLAELGIALGETLSPVPRAGLYELRLAVLTLDAAAPPEDKPVFIAALLDEASAELGWNHPVTLRIALVAQRNEADAERRLALLSPLASQRVELKVRQRALADRAVLLSRLERVGEAVEARRAALATAQRIAGPHTDMVMGAHHFLAEAMEAQGEHAEALAMLGPIFDAPRVEVPAKHPGFQATTRLAVRLLQALGRHDEAVARAEATAALVEGEAGRASPEYLLAVNTQAWALAEAGRGKAALRLAEDALVLAAGVPDTAESVLRSLHELVATLKSESADPAEAGGGAGAVVGSGG